MELSLSIVFTSTVLITESKFTEYYRLERLVDLDNFSIQISGMDASVGPMALTLMKNEPWFFGRMTNEDAESLLKNEQEGTFIVFESTDSMEELIAYYETNKITWTLSGDVHLKSIASKTPSQQNTGQNCSDFVTSSRQEIDAGKVSSHTRQSQERTDQNHTASVQRTDQEKVVSNALSSSLPFAQDLDPKPLDTDNLFGIINKDYAETMMPMEPDGTFFISHTKRNKNVFLLSVANWSGNFHFKIEKVKNSEYGQFKFGERVFRSLKTLTAYYIRNPILKFEHDGIYLLKPAPEGMEWFQR